jgi:SpoVK/Ycf46/Vps4 family AAA+-type ATPase
LDEAAIRRLARRIYVPLPNLPTRISILSHLLQQQQQGGQHQLTPHDVEYVAIMTDGYSGSDLAQLAKEASMQPLRELGERIRVVPLAQVRPVTVGDFLLALQSIRPSVSPESLQQMEEWNRHYGSYTSGR